MGITTEMHLRDSDEASEHRFDYKGMHRYLISMETFRLRAVFTEKETVLRVLDLLHDTCRVFHFDLYAYTFLPERLVIIARGKEEQSDMKAFLANFRSASAQAINAQLGHPLWKRKYTERVLRKKEDSRRVAEEVFQLPVKAGLAASAAEYEYQGSLVLRPRPTP